MIEFLIWIRSVSNLERIIESSIRIRSVSNDRVSEKRTIRFCKCIRIISKVCGSLSLQKLIRSETSLIIIKLVLEHIANVMTIDLWKSLHKRSYFQRIIES